jgi:hypothetical protein
MPTPYKVLSRASEITPPPAPEGSGSIPAPGSGAGDWPEDFHHENGNYRCHCICCKNGFRGYKRRLVCKACWEESRRKFKALSREEQEAAMASMQAEAEAWMAKHLNTEVSQGND